MQTKASPSRIAALSVAICALSALALVLTFRESAPLITAEAKSCLPLPSNIEKLGPTLEEHAGVAALAEYGEHYAELKEQLKPGDAVRTFETSITGGHLVMRGNCFIGQAVTWIR